jgi:GntR family transcriptional repressor for pyruvate dehydrogenase complex
MYSRPDFGAIDAQVVIDLLDARRLIEPYLAEHAALAASPDQIARLADLLARSERQLGGDDRALRKSNMAFHVEIARCAGNVVLTQVMESLVELYASEQSAMLVLANAREQDHRQHVAILAAIQSGDGQKAKTLMKRHLESAKRLMSARLAEASHAHKVGWLDASSRPDRSSTVARPLALEGEW